MQIRRAQPDDITSAAVCMAAALPGDPILGALFSARPIGQDWATARVFQLLLEARIGAGMPALVARNGSRVVGPVMEDDTVNPAWPTEIMARWTDLESLHPGLGGAFVPYDTIMPSGGADEPHHHPGALGDDPGNGGAPALERR